MTGYKIGGYLSCAGGACLVLAAWFDVLPGFGWFAAGALLFVLGCVLLRMDRARRDSLDAIDAITVIEDGIDLLD
jgi:hypothetical protein